MLQITLIGLLLLTLQGSAQVLQCPGTFPEECRCSNGSYGPSISCVSVALNTWNIQTTFDAISDAFNNTAAVMQMVSIDPAMVISPGDKVPAHSVSTLKIQSLYFYADHRYTKIHPDAFSGTYSTTTMLDINEMDFQDAEEIFDLISNFTALTTLYLDGNTLSHLPARAFHNDLQNLRTIVLRQVGLQSIGDLPFVELRNEMAVYLDNNSLTLANISDAAFVFSRRGNYLNLERNPGITHLPEEKFGEFLRGNENTIRVGCDSIYCDPVYFLQCDDRIDWICEAGITRIFGYLCLENGYYDIHDYCKQNFGNSSLYVENSEEVKEIQMADPVRYETLEIEEEFRRDLYASKPKRQKQTQV